jgi:general secretion pathway protein C
MATFLVWLLLAGSVAFWGLRFVKGPSAPASTSVATASPAPVLDPQALALGLGAGLARAGSTPLAASADAGNLQASRFVLSGVVVNQTGPGSGIALIATDGKPPRPYRVGTAVAEGVVLHSVEPGKAMLGASTSEKPQLTLDLPQSRSAVVGTAVPSRPALAATPAPVPSQIAAQREANPRSALEPRAPRFGANRQREGKAAAAEAPSEPKN